MHSLYDGLVKNHMLPTQSDAKLVNKRNDIKLQISEFIIENLNIQLIK